MTNRKIGIALAAGSLLATAFMIAGLCFVAIDMAAPAAAEQKPEETGNAADAGSLVPYREAEEIRLLALGDSLTKGTGDATGQGYVRRVADGLSKRYNKPVKLLGNLAINGMTAQELAERLERDEGYQYAVKGANLIVFSIGGNDLFLSAYASLNGRELNEAAIDELAGDLDEALERFKRVVERLNALNPNASVVYMGLYNPFFELEELRGASAKLQDWNRAAYSELFRHPQMLMVPTFDLFEFRVLDYLSSDHFHPNEAGYERIAERMLDSL
ncbi:GDSL-type esterase/lipase family protein [Paenibacillus nanensis]|nr:GDSL-type esterase/lipase family protein [Paenibacillus nanensis]